MNRLQPLALGIAIGGLWAAYVFIVGVAAIYGWGEALVQAFASLYVGYAASVSGAIIGAVWALLDGFIAGVVVAWIYNGVALSRGHWERERAESHGHPAGPASRH